MFQGSFKDVTSKFQASLKGVSRKFLGCFKEVSRTFQENLKGVSRKFHGSFKRVSKEFPCCFSDEFFKGDLRAFQGDYFKGISKQLRKF